MSGEAPPPEPEPPPSSTPAAPPPSAPRAAPRSRETIVKSPSWIASLTGAPSDAEPTVARAAPPPPPRRDPVTGPCPLCGESNRFEQRERRCGGCDCDLEEPESAGAAARIAIPPAEPRPPVAIPCPHCGRELRVPADKPGPKPRCENCPRDLAPAELPLDGWVDLSGPAQGGPQAEILIHLLRARWSSGAASPGEILRQAEALRRIVRWLQLKPEARACDFPTPVEPTAEILRHFVFKPAQAQVQSRNDDRVILAVAPEAGQGGSVMIAVAAVADGALLGFLADLREGLAAALAPVRVQEIRARIASATPRALFRYLAYRSVFGDWMRPATIAAVPRPALEREMRKLGVAEDRLGPLLERVTQVRPAPR